MVLAVTFDYILLIASHAFCAVLVWHDVIVIIFHSSEKKCSSKAHCISFAVTVLTDR